MQCMWKDIQNRLVLWLLITLNCFCTVHFTVEMTRVYYVDTVRPQIKMRWHIKCKVQKCDSVILRTCKVQNKNAKINIGIKITANSGHVHYVKCEWKCRTNWELWNYWHCWVLNLLSLQQCIYGGPYDVNKAIENAPILVLTLNHSRSTQIGFGSNLMEERSPILLNICLIEHSHSRHKAVILLCCRLLRNVP